jgi:hypothetical protein
MFATLMCCCFALQAGGVTPVPPATPAVEARTGDGRFVARIARAEGQEKVPESLARYRLNVLEQLADSRESLRWSVLYPFEGEAARFVLAPGGRAFAEARERCSDGRTVLSVQTAGGRTQWTGAELEITREMRGGDNRDEWLDPARETRVAWTDGPFGPFLELSLPLRDGSDRRIDVLAGRWMGDGRTATVEPAVQGGLPERVAVPYVHSVQVPRVVRAGRPIQISIQGRHATPNWRLLGFELEREDGVLHLTPRSEAPDGVQAQVLSNFQVGAILRDVPVGRYVLRVEGWSPGGRPFVLDVVPEHLCARLETRGGFAGVEQVVELYDVGLLRRRWRPDQPAEFVELAAERQALLEGLRAALPSEGRSATTKGAADLFLHTLGYWSGEEWITVQVDDLAATEAERAFLEGLRAD